MWHDTSLVSILFSVVRLAIELLLRPLQFSHRLVDEVVKFGFALFGTVVPIREPHRIRQPASPPLTARKISRFLGNTSLAVHFLVSDLAPAVIF